MIAWGVTTFITYRLERRGNLEREAIAQSCADKLRELGEAHERSMKELEGRHRRFYRARRGRR